MGCITPSSLLFMQACQSPHIGSKMVQVTARGMPYVDTCPSETSLVRAYGHWCHSDHCDCARSFILLAGDSTPLTRCPALVSLQYAVVNLLSGK